MAFLNVERKRAPEEQGFGKRSSGHTLLLNGYETTCWEYYKEKEYDGEIHDDIHVDRLIKSL